MDLYTADVKILCLPFWFSSEENEIFTNIAIKNDAFICDLSHISAIANSYASYENKVTNEGVGRHPSDLGMERIANALFAVVNASH